MLATVACLLRCFLEVAWAEVEVEVSAVEVETHFHVHSPATQSDDAVML